MFAHLDRVRPTEDENYRPRLAALYNVDPANADAVRMLDYRLGQLALLPRPGRHPEDRDVMEPAHIDPETALAARMFAAEAVLLTYSRALDQEALYRKGIDPLTGLERWERFRERLQAMYEHEPRQGELVTQPDGSVGRSLLILFVDGNRFGEINNAHDHDVGDQAIVRLAQPFHDLRAQDLKTRRGGDEFIAALPSLDYEAAAQLCGRFSSELAEGYTMPLKDSKGFLRITASTVAVYNTNVTSYRQASDLILQADKLLMAFKSVKPGRAVDITGIIARDIQNEA